MALQASGHFEWEEFQRRLITAVGRWEAEHPDGDGYRYYERWAEALELLGDRGIVAPVAIDERAAQLSRRRPRPRPLTMAEARRSEPAEARWRSGTAPTSACGSSGSSSTSLPGSAARTPAPCPPSTSSSPSRRATRWRSVTSRASETSRSAR